MNIMDSEFVSFIDHLYENISVYQALLVYPVADNVEGLIKLLNDKDYPVVHVTDADMPSITENYTKHRFFAVSDALFNAFVSNTFGTNLESVSLIVCTADPAHVCVQRFFEENNIKEDNLYIFSRNTV